MPLGSTNPAHLASAATLILARDAAEGPPDILLVERAADLAFAGGAVVFPGGRVDEADRALVADPSFVHNPPSDRDDAAARVAAIRETIEEAGIAVGTGASPASAALIQRGLLAGRAFADLLADDRLTLDLATLVPWARWRPHGEVARAFDTRFYLAVVGETPAPRPCTGEVVRAFWSPASAVLGSAARLIFPTRRNLERIAAQPDTGALMAHARATPIRAITPEIVAEAGGRVLRIPEGLGYPVTRAPFDAGGRG